MPRINVKDKRRQQLIEANLASIAKRGLNETTITHVSRGAGMSRGIVNFYFTSKERMMQDTLKYLAEEFETAWRAALEEVMDKPRQAQLAALIRAAFNGATCNQKRLVGWAAFWGHASAHAEYRKILVAADNAYLAALESVVPQQAPVGFAQQLYSMIKGAQLSFLLSAADKKALEALCLDFAEAAFAPAAVAKRASAKASDVAKPARKRADNPKEVQLGFDDLFAVAKQ